MQAKAVQTGLTILSITGVHPDRHETLKAAIMAGAGDLPGKHQAWVVPARRPPGYYIRMIGPGGFYREATFTGRESETEIVKRIRETMRHNGFHATNGGDSHR